MKYTRIYLIGFMGAGKSTVGQALARRLGWSFIDLDEVIETGEGRSIPSIFKDSGEFEFRLLESRYLKEVTVNEKAVIALGGGAFISPENRELAESTGLTVWLKVSFAKAASRVKMDGTRPMFASIEQAEALYHTRESHYSLAQVHVATDNRSVDAVVDEIFGAVRTI